MRRSARWVSCARAASADTPADTGRFLNRAFPARFFHARRPDGENAKGRTFETGAALRLNGLRQGDRHSGTHYLIRSGQRCSPAVRRQLAAHPYRIVIETLSNDELRIFSIFRFFSAQAPGDVIRTGFVCDGRACNGARPGRTTNNCPKVGICAFFAENCEKCGCLWRSPAAVEAASATSSPVRRLISPEEPLRCEL